jgi:hypothetical protein
MSKKDLQLWKEYMEHIEKGREEFKGDTYFIQELTPSFVGFMDWRVKNNK